MSVAHFLMIVRAGLIRANTMPIIVLSLCAACVPAAAQITAIIDIDTTSAIAITPGFSGVSDDLGFPVEYWDYHKALR